MPQNLNDPKYVYADILIALAQSDGAVDPRERKLLDGIFAKMNLDAADLGVMWQAPRTLDVVASILAGISSQGYHNCLLKDAYLLAYADDLMDPAEVAFLDQLRGLLNVDAATDLEVHAWVRAAIEQARQADRLFGGGLE
jgi:uncharacterized membrane protein YebE (DUF533 family)